MRETSKDKNRLLHIIEAIDNINEFKKDVTYNDFVDNKVLKYAIFYNVAIIGEAAYKLTKEFTTSHNDIPWRAIINMRHVIVHGYYQIDAEILWDTINNDLAELRIAVEKYLTEM
jgi:uncharacterized protein with HEPN domain